MAHDRRFRFGVQLSQPIPGYSWQDSARKVEDMGFSTLFMPDHFGDQLSPIPALAVAAEATTRLKVGSLVFDNDYRHPLVLAKDIATLDVLSEGRVEFGLGSGWMLTDYEESGIPYDAPKVRVDRFFEGVEVIRGLWSGEPYSFSGEYYDITSHTALPAPHTAGGPPLLIGGGAPRMLRFAGANADIVGVNPSIHSGAIDGDAARDAAADRFDQKVKWVKEGAGDRFDDIELNVLVFLASVTDDAKGLAEGMAPMFGIDADTMLQSPAVIAGTPAGIAEQLAERRSRWGVSYHVLNGDNLDEIAPIVGSLAGN